MFNEMHIMQFPSGKWGFVGKVHSSLNDKVFATEKAALLAAKFAERFGSLPVSKIFRNS